MSNQNWLAEWRKGEDLDALPDFEPIQPVTPKVRTENRVDEHERQKQIDEKRHQARQKKEEILGIPKDNES